MKEKEAHLFSFLKKLKCSWFSVVSVSGVPRVIQSCVCVCVFFFRLFSIIGYYKILNIVPCAAQ